MTREAEPLPPPGAPPARPLSSTLVRASVAILFAHVIAMVLGIAQTSVVASLCDPTTRDLFAFAFESVLGLLFLIGEEALGPALLPVFMEAKDKEGESRAWRFASAVLTWQTALIAAATAFVVLFPSVFVEAFTAWNEEGADPRYVAEAPHFVRWMVGGLFGMSLGSATYKFLNGYKRFFLAALGEAMLKIGFIGALVGGALWVGADASGHYRLAGETAAWVFGVGATAGGLLKLGIHLFGLRKELHYIRPAWGWDDPAFRRFVWLMVPLLAGILFAKFRDVFNQVYVISAVQEQGLVFANTAGRKIYQTFGRLVPYAVSIAMLPFFCDLVDRGRKEELGRLITRSSRLILLACAPLTALAMALSLPLARILYQRGAFTLADCELASTSNIFYILVLPFYALEYVFMQAFFSTRKMVSVTAIGVFWSALSMVGAYVGVVSWEATGAAALAAVALSFTLSRICKVLTLGGVMRRFAPCFPWRETLSFCARLAVVSVAAGLAAYAARLGVERVLPAPADLRGTALLVRLVAAFGVGGTVGAVATLALAFALLRADMNQLIDWTKERLRRRKSPRPPVDPDAAPAE